jgi:hypothetical protein
MSLNVSSELAEKAQSEDISDAEFVLIIRDSLPNAWRIVEDLVQRKKSGEAGVIQHAPKSMDDNTRGQLLRMMASDAMRGALQRHFGSVFAFQNCHATAIFLPSEIEEYRQWTSINSQILNQSPELRDC